MCLLGKGQRVEVKQLMQFSDWAPIVTFSAALRDGYTFIFDSIFPLMLRKDPSEVTHFPTLEIKLNTDLEG